MITELRAIVALLEQSTNKQLKTVRQDSQEIVDKMKAGHRELHHQILRENEEAAEAKRRQEEAAFQAK